jgi:hypothetical protein
MGSLTDWLSNKKKKTKKKKMPEEEAADEYIKDAGRNMAMGYGSSMT